ncbi:hypothetical protein CMK11_03310 [Candidatus Poribacteria bacterium]|nr:hypothetical protein [Candidatus Poribacteria bacterium]
MANEEHLEILRRGVSGWNTWRHKNRATMVDLHAANLSGADLSKADLSRADLSRANLSRANLSWAYLSGANLTGVDLRGADMDGTILTEAYLHVPHLRGAYLRGAHLLLTTFSRVDLRGVKGLEDVSHGGPSTIGIDTLYASGGEIPEKFLRGCGVPEEFITYARSLVGAAIEFYSCFISYSHKDEEFAQRLHRDLQAEGVRCWFAAEDMKIGDSIRDEIDRAIRYYDKLVLVLSRDSVQSGWVEDEAEAALEKETRRRGKKVLFPVRIDDAVQRTRKAWASTIRRKRHIGDFTQWKDHDAYQTAFQRVLRDLQSGSSQE